MKTIRTLSLLTALSIGVIALTSFRMQKAPADFTTSYDAQLVSTTQIGNNYEWVWTVTNPNPGNGLNGTMQNLSHWSLAISSLMTEQNIVSVAYSTDGVNWSSLPADLAIDKSQECYRDPVLKFDHGTTGSAPTYYKLVVNEPFTTGYTLANFKSGSKTGCYNSMVVGLGDPAIGGNR